MIKILVKKGKNPKTQEDCFLIRLDRDFSFMVETLYFKPEQIELSLKKVFKRIEDFINKK